MRSNAARPFSHVELGDAATIDAIVARLRTALADPASDPKPVARELGDSGAAVASNRGIGLGDLRRVKFPALPATEVEGRAIANALGAKLVMGAAATHDALANVHGPHVLHIATHGFFLQDNQTTSAPSRGLALDTTSASPTITADVDALFRSGLVLAGANGHRPNDTGVLTASEALWLDPWASPPRALPPGDESASRFRRSRIVLHCARTARLGELQSQRWSMFSLS